MTSPADWKRTAILLRVRYSAGLITAYTIGGVEVIVIIALLGRSNNRDAPSLLTVENISAGFIMLGVALCIAAVSTTKFVKPAFDWYARQDVPTPDQQQSALDITRRQTLVHVGLWTVGGCVLVLLNITENKKTLLLIALAVGFGGAAMACIGYLVSEATLRPIIAAAMAAEPVERPAPGVMQRLVFTWMLCTAIPTAAICGIVVDQYTRLVIPEDTNVQAPVLLLAMTSLGTGLLGTILVSKSVSDPVQDVGRAMGEVERGNTDVRVEVHDSSEIGRLQMGFNRMVAGVAERERLQDLFGRHVGHDVASRAMEQDGELGGDVRYVAVLFIDLVGSTNLAATRPPTEVATVLNDFFRIVVTAVDDHGGLINKFTGDAALAIFGAPEAVTDPAAAALATARTLRSSLSSLDLVDFGIGVSYGPVFAGNIGAEQRYEYTVIGDPVNEAARLTELAKSRRSRILVAAQVVSAANPAEAAHWKSRGRTTLRGRSRRTVYAEPLDVVR
ncbi:adenylate/guanylate cyclase domain-containing protein [Antrihabitans sp. YC2-6]|uniref:adenylate/guanylate cyclase domain-containing protein n=1 Tax=Antrihabitans sp. YC2-6 TaxID=2799498 RepID=UPI0018F603C8|nr:adenylate/guanylate cyclase domain-containing protein [Antrihabitans sp. YC2-6]MBJ8346340.1 adenylate/guanylate cyclase domain-containing protein [Antrihabitans sp. YC2-6]